VQFGLSGYADLLGKGHLMSAMEMIIEPERSVRLGFFAERVQELDNVVSRYRPNVLLEGFPFIEERNRCRRCGPGCASLRIQALRPVHRASETVYVVNNNCH
jgi:hypothetical protein